MQLWQRKPLAESSPAWPICRPPIPMRHCIHLTSAPWLPPFRGPYSTARCRTLQAGRQAGRQHGGMGGRQARCRWRGGRNEEQCADGTCSCQEPCSATTVAHTVDSQRFMQGSRQQPQQRQRGAHLRPPWAPGSTAARCTPAGCVARARAPAGQRHKSRNTL